MGYLKMPTRSSNPLDQPFITEQKCSHNVSSPLPHSHTGICSSRFSFSHTAQLSLNHARWSRPLGPPALPPPLCLCFPVLLFSPLLPLPFRLPARL
jgi:hypothetical protein